MFGYLDCNLLALGTRMYVAKEKFTSNVRYASHLGAIKADEIKTNLKSKTEQMKQKVDEIKVKHAKTTDTEVSNEKVVDAEIVEETVETKEIIEPVKEEKPVENVESARVEETQGMNIPITPESEVKYGPDFSLLQGVTYDPVTDNFTVSKEPEQVQSDNTNVYGFRPEVITGTLDDEEPVNIVKEEPGVIPKEESEKPVEEPKLKEVTLEDLEIAFAKADEEKKKQTKPNKQKPNTTK